MDGSVDLLFNAVISGLLLGGFYAAVSMGVAISFGLLDVVNIAHPAFILLGSYVAFIGNTVFGIDPILAALIATPAFYVLGLLAYQVYYVAFERRDDQSLRGLSFFFGILFITVASAWQFSGYIMALYLAALRGIPIEVKGKLGIGEFQAFNADQGDVGLHRNLAFDLPGSDPDAHSAQ